MPGGQVHREDLSKLVALLNLAEAEQREQLRKGLDESSYQSMRRHKGNEDCG